MYYTLERIDADGYRVGDIVLVEPTSFTDARAFIKEFFVNNACTRMIEAILYDSSGKIVASHAS